MYKDVTGNKMKKSDCYDDVNFSHVEVVKHIKDEWDDQSKEWYHFERIIISN